MKNDTINAGWLKRRLVWIRRIGRCRGFGVQSPWAYNMVVNVINDHSPYSAYAPLAEEFKGQSRIRRKLNELYLRLANNIQFETVVDFCGDDDEVGGDALTIIRPDDRETLESEDGFWAYMNVGLGKAKDAKGVTGAANLPKDGVALVRLKADEHLPIYLNKVGGAAKDGWIVIVEGIHGSAKVRRQWCEWIEKSDNIVVFDLYYCGLVFFDSKRYKQEYIINF